MTFSSCAYGSSVRWLRHQILIAVVAIALGVLLVVQLERVHFWGQRLARFESTQQMAAVAPGSVGELQVVERLSPNIVRLSITLGAGAEVKVVPALQSEGVSQRSHSEWITLRAANDQPSQFQLVFKLHLVEGSIYHWAAQWQVIGDGEIDSSGRGQGMKLGPREEQWQVQLDSLPHLVGDEYDSYLLCKNGAGASLQLQMVPSRRSP